MIGDVYTQVESVKSIRPPSDWQQLEQENRSLRTMIVDLLIKNQNLRFELLQGSGSATSPVCET